VLPNRTWALMLAAILIAFCLLGNAVSADPHRVSVFPIILGIFAFPLVIVPALNRASRKGGSTATVPVLRRIGWAITWPAALLFAAFFEVLTVFTFQQSSPEFLVAGFVGTFVVAATLGLLTTQLSAAYLARQRSRERKMAPHRREMNEPLQQSVIFGGGDVRRIP